MCQEGRYVSVFLLIISYLKLFEGLDVFSGGSVFLEQGFSIGSLVIVDQSLICHLKGSIDIPETLLRINHVKQGSNSFQKGVVPVYLIIILLKRGCIFLKGGLLLTLTKLLLLVFIMVKLKLLNLRVYLHLLVRWIKIKNAF